MAPYFEKFGYKPWIITMRSNRVKTGRIPSDQVIEIGDYKRGELEKARWGADIRFVRKVDQIGLRPLYLDQYLWIWGLKVWAARNEIKQKIGRVDCILGSFGPASALWIAKTLAKHWNVPWVADFRDLGALMENQRHSFIRRLDGWLEKRWLRTARAAITVGPTFKEIVASKYNKPSRVIYNGFDEPVYSTSGIHTGLHEQIRRPYVHYAGQIYFNQIPSFELALRGLSRLKHLQMVFRILGPRYIENKLKKYAEELGLVENKRILFLPPAEREIVTGESEKSMANLVVAQMYEPSRGTLPAKFFGLLPLTPPLLGVGPEDSDLGNLMRETRKGALCETAEAIAAFLEAVERNPRQFSGEPLAIQKYSRSSQARRLSSFLDELLDGGGSGRFGSAEAAEI